MISNLLNGEQLNLFNNLYQCIYIIKILRIQSCTKICGLCTCCNLIIPRNYLKFCPCSIMIDHFCYFNRRVFPRYTLLQKKCNGCSFKVECMSSTSSLTQICRLQEPLYTLLTFTSARIYICTVHKEFPQSFHIQNNR